MSKLTAPVVIENVFDDITNSIIINTIMRQRGWSISGDEYRERINKSIDTHHSDTGMLLRSFCTQQGDYLNNHNTNVNVYGNLILEKVLSLANIKFKNIGVQRFLWNYYNRASTGVEHKDIYDCIDRKFNYCSIVYYLNTNDGYTVINGQRVDSVSGRAVLFDSYSDHYGVGPVESKNRFVLNIVFGYETEI